MQKKENIGKAHRLFKPTLVRGLSLSTPSTADPQKQGSSAYTLNLHCFQIFELESPWGRRQLQDTTVRGLVVLGAYKT